MIGGTEMPKGKDNANLARPPLPALLRFYDDLLAGNVDSLLNLFNGEPDLNTPLRGEVKGYAAFERFVTEEQAWLSERKARPEFVNAIISDERIVLELIVYLTLEGEEIDLPIAIAADRKGAGVSAIRVYHSTWPLTGEHIVRPTILDPPERKPEEPAVIEAYMTGIGKPDKELVLSLFTQDGYVRQPSGARYKHTGPEGLHQFYDPALDAGGIVLHHVTATFDGHSIGIEFICDEWANVKLPPQAGLAVYELAGTDKIQAARIYDDVNPPFE
jgi:hypothetical protein